MKRHINKFATRADIKTALSNEELFNPYVAYIEDEESIDWNTKRPTPPDNEIWFSIDKDGIRWKNENVFPVTGWGANLESVNWDGLDCKLKFDGTITEIPRYGLTRAANKYNSPYFTRLLIPDTVTSFGERCLEKAYCKMSAKNLFRYAVVLWSSAFWQGSNFSNDVMIFGEKLSRQNQGYFDGNTGTKNYVFLSLYPPTLSNSVDNTFYLNGGFIYVPNESVDRYKTATNWTPYADKIKPLSECPFDISE